MVWLSRMIDIFTGKGYGMEVCCDNQHKTIITTSLGNWKVLAIALYFPAIPTCFLLSARLFKIETRFAGRSVHITSSQDKGSSVLRCFAGCRYASLMIQMTEAPQPFTCVPLVRILCAVGLERSRG